MLIDPGVFPDVHRIIKKPSAFHIVRLGWIYAAISKIAQRHESIDLLTVSSELAKNNLLEESGGELYLAELINTVPTALSATTYAREVADRWQDRRILQAASEIARIGFMTQLDQTEKRAKAKSVLASAFDGMDARERLSWADTVDQSLEQMYERVWGEAQAFFTFGISDLDRLLDESLEPGNMIIVAAPRKRGKSTMMRGAALINAKCGKPVAIFSHEEREHNIARTMLSREALSTVSTASLRRMVHQEDRGIEAAAIYNRLIQKGNELKRFPIHAIYAGGWTAEDEVMEMERLRDVAGVKLFIVDYAQRVKESGKRERRLELARIGLVLANAAHDLGVSILLGSQVNANGMTREAEDLENECDAKILITAEEDDIATQKPGAPIAVSINVELNRHGPTGKIDAMFNGAHGLFTSAERIGLGSWGDK